MLRSIVNRVLGVAEQTDGALQQRNFRLVSKYLKKLELSTIELEDAAASPENENIDSDLAAEVDTARKKVQKATFQCEIFLCEYEEREASESSEKVTRTRVLSLKNESNDLVNEISKDLTLTEDLNPRAKLMFLETRK